jgi:hypothetical protein
VKHGLRGGDDQDEIGLDERTVDAKRDVAYGAELHEGGFLDIVNQHPTGEIEGEAGCDEPFELAPPRSPSEPSSNENRHALVCNARTAELGVSSRDRGLTRILLRTRDG